MASMSHHTHQDMQPLEGLLTDVAGNFRYGDEPRARTALSERLPVILRPLLMPAGSVGLTDSDNKEQSGFVVHYTAIETVVNMLHQVRQFNKKRGWSELGGAKGIAEPTFRMYHTEGFNDPSEGAVVNKFCEELSDKYAWLDLPTKRGGAYACSFVAAEEAGKNDDLMFWRLYGKDGTGCSIKIVSHTVRAMLSRVQYWNENEEREGYSRVRAVLDTIDGAVNNCQPIGKICGDIVVAFLNRYRYYLKNRHYEHEKECRLVRAESDAKNVVSDTQKFPHIRCYINEGPKLKDVFSTDTVITVGPQAHTPYAAKAYIESLLRDAELVGKIGVEVSKISYKNS